MLLRSKPKSLGEATVNLYGVDGGLWELVLLKEDGTATEPMRASAINDVIDYVIDVLHAPVVLHTPADIVFERLANMKTVTGTITETDIHLDRSSKNTFDFQPNGSDKVVRITTPSHDVSAGLEMSNRALLLAGHEVTITYEIRYATGGDEPVRELCGLDSDVRHPQ